MADPLRSDDDHGELKVAMRAVWSALADTSKPDMVTAGTAAYWIAVIDEYALSQLADDYVKIRKADGMSEVLDGIAFARNTITHSLTNPTRQSGITFPIEFPIDFGPMIWARTEVVEQTHRARKGREQLEHKRDGFRLRLEGKPYMEALGEAADWLSRTLTLPATAD